MCSAVSKPVNALAVPGLTFVEMTEAGARRVSVGGGLTWVAVQAMVDAAVAIRDSGDFTTLDADEPPVEWLDART